MFNEYEACKNINKHVVKPLEKMHMIHKSQHAISEGIYELLEVLTLTKHNHSYNFFSNVFMLDAVLIP